MKLLVLALKLTLRTWNSAGLENVYFFPFWVVPATISGAMLLPLRIEVLLWESLQKWFLGPKVLKLNKEWIPAFSFASKFWTSMSCRANMLDTCFQPTVPLFFGGTHLFQGARLKNSRDFPSGKSIIYIWTEKNPGNSAKRWLFFWDGEELKCPEFIKAVT